ncbi:hypothetical protein BV22DRAFT_1033795 [Leucogyrophana mollusca]|uniref:Uncharacterized protein n=1 Tax=Leucogyrophana mollusca TaxID=85980 RepID=A0ACB8BK72_9AGAM|nr:hypothetical protein BV22DRAFT_1033795 [Leucogyrophana mollusca]
MYVVPTRRVGSIHRPVHVRTYLLSKLQCTDTDTNIPRLEASAASFVGSYGYDLDVNPSLNFEPSSSTSRV